MTTGTGQAAQIMYAIEGTPGTRQAPTRSLPFTDEGLQLRQNRIKSKAYRAGRRTSPKSVVASSWVEGPVSCEFAPQGGALALRLMMGTVVTTGAGPYTHTATPGPIPSATFQVGRPFAESTTVQPFDYVGCEVTSWELAFALNEFLKLTLNLYGTHEDTSQTLGSFAAPTGWDPFVFSHGVLTIAGTEQKITGGSVRGENALKTGRWFMRSTTPTRPQVSTEGGERTYSGQVETVFTSLTAYNRFVNGTEAAVSLVFTSGSNVLTIAGNAVFTGETPNVEPAELMQRLPFEFLGSATDPGNLTITLVNGDSAP